MNKEQEAPAYPLPITRWLEAAEKSCAAGEGAACHEAALKLADALVYYLGAVAVGQYSQALYRERVAPDPTLNRSLRSLRRVLPGQWLGWASRGLAAMGTGEGAEAVSELGEWYSREQGGPVAQTYTALREIMVESLGYTGEYEARDAASPRNLLELIDQYRIRRSKTPAEVLPPDIDERVAEALLAGLRAVLEGAGFLWEYELYAPNQRHLLMGRKAVSPMPPISSPTDAAATLLLYPPGEAPDYTKRPNLQAERMPLFPLDPLLAYMYCAECGGYRVAALQEVAGGSPSYVGLDPDCQHTIRT